MSCRRRLFDRDGDGDGDSIDAVSGVVVRLCCRAENSPDVALVDDVVVDGWGVEVPRAGDACDGVSRERVDLPTACAQGLRACKGPLLSDRPGLLSDRGCFNLLYEDESNMRVFENIAVALGLGVDDA